jgi:transcription elongation factor Elf1
MDRPRKNKEGNTADRPKYNTTAVKCPYCDVISEQRTRFAFGQAIPNLIECSECKNHFILLQKVEIVNTVVDIQHELDKGLHPEIQATTETTGEAGMREPEAKEPRKGRAAKTATDEYTPT